MGVKPVISSIPALNGRSGFQQLDTDHVSCMQIERGFAGTAERATDNQVGSMVDTDKTPFCRYASGSLNPHHQLLIVAGVEQQAIEGKLRTPVGRSLSHWCIGRRGGLDRLDRRRHAPLSRG